MMVQRVDIWYLLPRKTRGSRARTGMVSIALMRRVVTPISGPIKYSLCLPLIVAKLNSLADVVWVYLVPVNTNKSDAAWRVWADPTRNTSCN